MDHQKQGWERVLRELNEGRQPNPEHWEHLTQEEKELLNTLQKDHLTKEVVDYLGMLNDEQEWTAMRSAMQLSSPVVTKTITMKRWLRYAAAVLIPLLLVGGGMIWFGNSRDKQALVKAPPVPPTDHKRATLVLADGKEVALHKYPDATLLETEGTAITNRDTTTLHYAFANEKAGNKPAAYNSLIIPRGGEYKLVLADGTEIWLNAATALRYPVHFNGAGRREVYLEKGEAYFKVTKNTAQPFIVHVKTPAGNDAQVQVLGTSFNINTYSTDIQTTLAEGKVQLTTPNGQTLSLAPDQQATLYATSGKLDKETVDITPFVAWKDGWMIFDNSKLYQVMEQLGRWYDYDIVFSSDQLKNVHFGGKLRRYQPIEAVLSFIERTGSVHCHIQNKTIYINEKSND